MRSKPQTVAEWVADEIRKQLAPQEGASMKCDLEDCLTCEVQTLRESVAKMQADFVARLGAQASLHQGELQKLRERNRALREALRNAHDILEAARYDAEWMEPLLAEED